MVGDSTLEMVGKPALVWLMFACWSSANGLLESAQLSRIKLFHGRCRRLAENDTSESDSLYKELRQRSFELQRQDSGNSEPGPANSLPDRTAIVKSVSTIAVAVGFATAALILSGDAFTAADSSLRNAMPVRVDAEEVLRKDFEQDKTSVFYN